MDLTLPKIIQAIKVYERNRGGVTALHPGRYQDLAEYLLLIGKKGESEIMATEFARWISDNCWLPGPGEGQWTEKAGGYLHGRIIRIVSSEELFRIYSREKQKKISV